MDVILAMLGNISCFMCLSYFAEYLKCTGISQFIEVIRKGGVWTPLLLTLILAIVLIYVSTWVVVLG